jgi:5-methylcytosine-specific restriction protein A
MSKKAPVVKMARLAVPTLKSRLEQAAGGPKPRQKWGRHRSVDGHARPYDSARWRRIRQQQLEADPLCAHCAARGLTVPADTVDHVRDHKGDEQAFWYGALQSLCRRCHTIKTTTENAQRAQDPRGGDRFA